MNSLIAAKRLPRFDGTALMILTEAQMLSLIKWQPPSEHSDAKVRKFLVDYKLEAGLYASELELVSKARLSKASGTIASGSPYEERMYAKKGTVAYSPTSITLTARTGEVRVLPNLPLAPANPPKREHETRVAMTLYAFYDFSKGELTNARDGTLDNEWFQNPATNYKPEGVDLLKHHVLAALKDYPAYKGLLVDKTTITGHLAADFWFAFAASLTNEDLVAFHRHIINYTIRHVVIMPDAKSGLWRPHAIPTAKADKNAPDVFPVPIDRFARISFPGSEEYKRRTEDDTVIWVKPIAPRAMMKNLRDPVDILIMYKKHTTLIGGKSRGVGLQTTWADYCPRQSETIRRLNWFVMAITNAGSGTIDVHVKPGDLALMNLLLATKIAAGDVVYKTMNLVISHADTKGQLRKSYYATESRPGALQIEIMDWLFIPDVSSDLKKQKDNDEAVTSQYQVFLSRLAALGSRYLIQAPFFTPDQAGPIKLKSGSHTHSVFRHGRGHDLQATFATHLKVLLSPSKQNWLEPTNWADFTAAAKLAFRYFSAWHHCAEPVYNHLGTWYAPDTAKVEVVDGEWHFKDDIPPVRVPVISSSPALDDVPDQGGSDPNELIQPRPSASVVRILDPNNSSGYSQVRFAADDVGEETPAEDVPDAPVASVEDDYDPEMFG